MLSGSEKSVSSYTFCRTWGEQRGWLNGIGGQSAQSCRQNSCVVASALVAADEFHFDDSSNPSFTQFCALF
eukprot:scaffold198899_cov26-Tisochrysis_lutea.AAC.1